MKIKLFLLFLLLFSFSFNKVKKPGNCKLIVLIAIDGLRGDLLEKYKPAFHYGFKRLFDEGFDYKNAWDCHAITVSHAGHVTLATGNYPKTHGIVDAAFYEKQGDSLVFTDAFADSAYVLAGVPGFKSISEKKVLTPGLAEWVKSSKLPGKVLCVGTGNISSALYCFHPNENVFWYSGDLGKYVTSTYFMQDEPQWIKDFNREKLSQFFMMSKSWNNIVPDKFMHLSNKDDDAFENYGKHHVFPYIASARVEKENLYNLWILNTPFIDNATLALAEQGIVSLSMGKGISTDYLSIVLSQVDDISHSFGPSSLENFNVLLQMDIALGNFFTFLDQKLGKGNYDIALSADHGFAEIPEQTLAKGKWAERLKEDKVEKTMNGVKALTGLYKNKIKRLQAIKSFLKKQDFIADVYTPAQLNNVAVSKDQYLELYKKSYRKDRVPRLPFFSLKSFQSEIAKEGLMVRLKENTMIDLDCVIHGSPYDYDRYVPLIFMGNGVKKGSSMQKVYTVDVAPSLAKLGNISVSNKTDGKSLF